MLHLIPFTDCVRRDRFILPFCIYLMILYTSQRSFQADESLFLLQQSIIFFYYFFTMNFLNFFQLGYNIFLHCGRKESEEMRNYMMYLR